MTSEQLLKWMNDSELTPTDIADATKYRIGYLRNIFCGAAPVSVLLKRRLKKAYPDDLELTRILDGCPHCWDGLQGDNDDGPVYCEYCRQGLQLELARINSRIETLDFAIKDGANPSTWMTLHVSRLRLNQDQYKGLRKKTERKLMELEAS